MRVAVRLLIFITNSFIVQRIRGAQEIRESNIHCLSMRACFFSFQIFLTLTLVLGHASAITAPGAGAALPAGPATIALYWIDNSNDETGFEIERFNGASWDLIATTEANANYYYDRGLSSETSYTYRVSAVNTDDTSAAVLLGSASTTKQMNIIFFLADDMGYKDIVALRNSAIDGPTIHETPALDSLAAESLVAKNAYCSGPRCVVARRAIQTGTYDWRPEVVPSNDYYVDHDGAPIGGGLWAGGVTVAGSEAGAGVTIPFDNETYGEALKAAGYRTCFIGKYHLGESPSIVPVTGYTFGDQPARGPDMQGYDVSIGAGHAGAPPASYFSVENMHASGSYTFELPNLDDANYGCSAPVPGEYLTDRLTDKAIGFIDDAISNFSDKAFCLTLAHYAVHTPIEAKASDITYFQEKKASMTADFAAHPAGASGLITDYSVRTRVWQDNVVYAAMMRSYDNSLAELRAYLAATDDPRYPGMKLSETTILVVSSDHGGKSTTPIADNKTLEDDTIDAVNSAPTYDPVKGAYKSGSPNAYNSYPTSNYPFRQGKTWVYEGGLKVPLIVYYPGLTPSGERTDAFIHHTDLFATFLDMAGGAQSMNSTDSISFMLTAAKPELSAREELYHFFTNANRGTGNPAIGAYRRGDYKLLYFIVQRRVELYNLAADPYERNNLANSRPDLAAEMFEALYEAVVSHGTKMPKPGSNSWTSEQNEVLLRNGLIPSLPAVPNANPSGLSLAELSPKTVELNWTVNATNATHSVVYRRADALGESAYREHAYLPVETTTFRDYNLIPGGQYRYRIESENLGGWAAGNTGDKLITLSASGTPLAVDAVDDTVTTVPGELRRFNPLGNDEGEGALTITAITPPTAGTATIDGSHILYQAPPGFAGTVSMTYTIEDGASQTDSASVTFNLPQTEVTDLEREAWDFEGEDPGDGLRLLSNSGSLNSDWNINTASKNDVADGSGRFVLNGASGTYTRKLPDAGTLNAKTDSDFYAEPVSTGKHRLEVAFASWSADAASNGDDWQIRLNDATGSRIASMSWRVDSGEAKIQYGGFGGNYRTRAFALIKNDPVTAAVEIDFDNDTIDYLLDGAVIESFTFEGGAIGQLIFSKGGLWATAATTVTLEHIKLTESVPAGTIYDAFVSAYKWDGILATEASQDPDHDGFSNLEEFAFGMSPTQKNSTSPIQIGYQGASPVLEFTPVRDTSGLLYTLQYSVDLVDWETIPQEILASPAGQAVQRDLPEGEKGFARILLNLP